MSADTLVPSTGYLVWRLAAKWRAGLDRAIGHLGLTSAQYGVLASLHGLAASGTQPSQRELAEFVGFEPMFVSTLARSLERSGLVERRAHVKDPRALQLGLTPRGVKVLRAARKIVVQLEQQRLAVLGGHESRGSVALRESLVALLRDASTTSPAPRPSANAKRRTSARQRPTRDVV
ncbi:MAG: MarR family winged helix-turn-helix transcriptional regulator [Vicinamibacteraceae bacterium]